MSRALALCTIALAALAVLAAGCAPSPASLPREWREQLYGPDATPTPLLRNMPTAGPQAALPATPTPPALATRIPTATTQPSRTSTPTHTATATPALAYLTLRQDTPWYLHGAFVPYEGTEDSYISAWSKAANYADTPLLSVRQGDVMAALIYFHLGDLPADLPIYYAEMGLYVSGRSNETPLKLGLRSLLKPWQLKEATWQNARQGLSWQTPGALGETDRQLEPIAELDAMERGTWLTVDVTDLVQQWLADPQANQGIIINGEAPLSVQYDITSANSPDTRHRPYLMLTLPTGALALGPAKVNTATPTVTATVDAARPETANLLPLLPQGTTVVARAFGDLGDGKPAIVAAFRSPLGQSVRLGIFHYYGDSAAPAGYRLDWSSQELPAALPTGVELVDLTGDGVAEILVSAANPSGAGRALYVFTAMPSGYRLAQPVGGYFDGKVSFGESGYDLAAGSSGERVNIAARHGNQTDVYAWDGANFTLLRP